MFKVEPHIVHGFDTNADVRNAARASGLTVYEYLASAVANTDYILEATSEQDGIKEDVHSTINRHTRKRPSCVYDNINTSLKWLCTPL